MQEIASQADGGGCGGHLGMADIDKAASESVFELMPVQAKPKFEFISYGTTTTQRSSPFPSIYIYI